MYLCDLMNHPESIIKVENDSRYYDESRCIYNRHFVNYCSSDLCFKGMIINNCSFNGFTFSVGCFKGCVIENCRFYNCTFDKDAFIGCIITGNKNYLFGCYVIGGFTYNDKIYSSNDPIYRSLHTLMHRLPDGFRGCRNLCYTDWSFIEHKRFYNESIESRIVRYSRIKKARELIYSIFVNVTFYKCDFVKCSPMGCIFINCTFIDCPFDTDSFRGCILCECKGGFDTTYSV